MMMNRLTWLNIMVKEPYYLFHFLLFFSYLPIRLSSSPILSPDFSLHLLRREIQAFLAFSVFALVKVVREETWEGFIADSLFFGKQPAFPELGASSTITPLQLETTLTEGDASRFWLVEFRALYSSTCARISRNFPELSITIVDLGLFPNVAETFGISIRGSVGLPTYILFEKNEEVARFPGLDFESKVSHPVISKKELSRHFELDRLLLEYVNGK